MHLKMPSSTKTIFFLTAALFIYAPAFAQTAAKTSTYAAAPDVPSSADSSKTYASSAASGAIGATKPVDRASYLQGLKAAMEIPFDGSSEKNAAQDEEAAAERARYLGTIDDPESPMYKSHKLADQASRQRADAAALEKGVPREDILGEFTPPPDITTLQHVSEAYGETPASIADDPISKEMALDMRRDAQREAALSYGARGGLAKRNYQIMERMRGYEASLDGVFNFRQLLIRAPSGLLIEPPIVKESLDAMVINASGDEAAVADSIYNINKNAKIVSAPRDWRQYLMRSWSEVPPPPRVLWPRTKEETGSWATWVSEGWEAGQQQADQIFEANVNQLVADYNGMVRYRMLLAQGMISAPYAMHEDRGVTGDKNQMRVGDRAIRITGPSQFLTGAELWKPADR